MKSSVVLTLVASCVFMVQGEDPHACQTPDGQTGTCVGIHFCPHLVKYVQLGAHVTKKEINFIKESSCTSQGLYGVCCGKYPPIIDGECKSSVTLPEPNSGCCGIESTNDDRITGGNDASIDQFPWQVLIEYYAKDGSTMCGGALISGRYVLTAAHCVDREIRKQATPRNVRLGEYDISNDPKFADCASTAGGGTECTRGVTVIPIEKTITHEGYIFNFILKKHDIALIRLAEMAPYTEFIRPICLPEADITTTKSDIRFVVAGWGRVNSTHADSSIKQFVEVPYVDLDTCQEPRITLLDKGHICAGEEGKGTCKGDSGGPLMYEKPGKVFEAVGITSFGFVPCAQEGKPEVYTRVYEYLDWIKKNIEP